VLPGPGSVVLANRKLRRNTDRSTLSRFGDQRWILTPALFEEHADALSLDFAVVPEPFRHTSKTILWLLLNHAGDDGVAFFARTHMPAIRTAAHIHRHLRPFTEWLTERGITAFAQVTAADLDDYAVHVKHRNVSHSMREDLLAAVVRAWTVRHVLPEADRLPSAAPWGGERVKVILGQGRHFGENRTPRIHPATMTALLSWALRFVDLFADDVIAAFDDHNDLSGRAYQTKLRQTATAAAVAAGTARSPRRGPNTIPMMIEALLADYHVRGLPLPGQRGPGGAVTVNTHHLGVELGAQLHDRYLPMITASGLPIADDTYCRVPVTATLDGRPWLPGPLLHRDAPVMARHLSTACYIVIGYLSGQRPGETLNLERGCTTHDPATGLVLLHGRHFKGVRAPDGACVPEGEIRNDPWVTIAPVAAAVAVLERLHDAQLLFPNTMMVNGRSSPKQLHDRIGRARGSSLLSLDIAAFTTWINDYCHTHGRSDVIPADPTTPEITPSRLRRTLAWFIVRQPRGLIAAAIQYGHVKVSMTLGYSGSYASGFPDDLAFEEWLDRIDTLTDAHERLTAGEHVSGPAANAYQARVSASSRFAGQTARTRRDAATLLANPVLQVFPGKGMTCVLDPAKAACRLTGDERGTRRTPDLDSCQPHCGNIARTDLDIDHLRRQAAALRAVVNDPIAPPIRHAREAAELDRLTQIITRHQAGANP
jgi:integrase